MKKHTNKSLISSFKHATRGLAVAIKTERNITFAVVFGTIAFITAYILSFKMVEYALLIVCISFVVFAELVNTSLEYLVDSQFGNKYSEVARFSKDVAAASVLLALLNAGIVGCLLFIPKIIPVFIDLMS